MEKLPLKARLQHPLARFFVVLVVVYVIWFVVYEVWVGPDGRLDEWLSLRVAAVTAGFLNVLGWEAFVAGRHLWMEGISGVLVVDDCNGVSSLGLFVAFVLAFPGPWRARLWFVPLGIALVYVVNVVRIAGLVVIQAHAPAAFDVAHEVGFTLIFYAAIFGLWVVWTRLGDGNTLRARPQMVPAS
jgi:exosortase family protein XrtF